MSILASMTSGINAAATSGTNTTTNYNPLDVSDEVSKITNQNSLAMRSAKSLGNQAAASRGMQNSTLGAEAAQRAMLDAALPMAQQNVSQKQQTALQDDAQNFTSQQNALDRNLTTSQNALDRNLTTSQNALDRELQTSLQEDSVRANTVGAYLDAAKELQTSFFDAYKEIQASEVPAAQKQTAIQDLYNKQQQQLNAMKSMYKNIATTEADWSDFADLIN
ncbi:hypothetical protein ACF8PD_13555 [Vibrio plantisponsor]|uniref:hypothetical protein n=1 Tax=Vibrio plantisponsor TaxID=664643 RepID=UPI00370A89A6